MYWLSHTKGISTMVRVRTEWIVNVTRRRQYSAPMVFGTISENTRIAMVIATGTTTLVIHGLA